MWKTCGDSVEKILIKNQSGDNPINLVLKNLSKNEWCAAINLNKNYRVKKIFLFKI